MDLSPSYTGVDPSQQTLSVLGHLLRPNLPPLPPDGVLPSAHVEGLLPSGQGGVDLEILLIHDKIIIKNLSPSNTGADPSEHVGLDPSAHLPP